MSCKMWDKNVIETFLYNSGQKVLDNFEQVLSILSFNGNFLSNSAQKVLDNFEQLWRTLENFGQPL